MTLKELAQHLTELAKLQPHVPVLFGIYPDPKLTRVCTVKLVKTDKEQYVFIGQ
jgi:hypothetical protein